MHGIVQSGPFACRRGRWNVCGCKDLLRYIRLQGCSKITIVLAINPEKARVQLRLDIYTPPSWVREAYWAVGAGRNCNINGVRECLRNRRSVLYRQNSTIDRSKWINGSVFKRVGLERSVPYEFGVDSAVAGVIDVLCMRISSPTRATAGVSPTSNMTPYCKGLEAIPPELPTSRWMAPATLARAESVKAGVARILLTWGRYDSEKEELTAGR